MSSSRQFSWPRIFAEGLAIVVSILLAFGIQAWWEGQQRDRERLELLVNMLESVRLKQTSIEESIAALETDQAIAAEFYDRRPADLSNLPTDSALAFFNSLYRPNTRLATQGPLSRLLSGPQISLIEDASVLEALDQWLVDGTELEERARNIVQVELEVAIPLGEHEAFQQRNYLAVGDRLPPTLNLSSVRADMEVMRAATAMVLERRVYMAYCIDALETLARLEAIILSLVD